MVKRIFFVLFSCVLFPTEQTLAGSAIVVDLGMKEFQMSDVAGGVTFDLDANGLAEPISWSAAGGDEAFLVLDRNGNGVVDDGRELFGSQTPQPASSDPSGFAALAVYDAPANGGNGDGIIDAHDAVFNSLKLWRDANHNGFSEIPELWALPAHGVSAISLDVRSSGETDRHGNRFRLRGKVTDFVANVGRWAREVVLLTGP